VHLDVDIHNYYEHLVVEYITTNDYVSLYNKEFTADVCCLALNELPPRYIRHDIDMAFYLTSAQRQAMEQEVDKAMRHSLAYLLNKDTSGVLKQASS